MKKLLITILLSLPLLASAQSNPVIPAEKFGAEGYNLTSDIEYFNKDSVEINFEGRVFKYRDDVIGPISKEQADKYMKSEKPLSVNTWLSVRAEDRDFSSISFSTELPSGKFLTCNLSKRPFQAFRPEQYFCRFSNIEAAEAAFKIAKTLNVVHAEILGLSDDNRGIKMRNFHSYPGLSAVLPSGSSSFKAIYDFHFVNCIDDFGRTLDLSKPKEMGSIESLFERLRDKRFDKINICSLVSEPPIITTEKFDKNKQYFIDYYKVESVELTISTEDHFTASFLDPGGRPVRKVGYTEIESARDSRRRQNANENLKKFITWIKLDYATHLMNIYYKKMDPAHIQLASEAFFNANIEKLQAVLGEIRNDYSQLSLMEKISWLRNLNIALDTVHDLEVQLKAPMTVSLDNVIRTRIQ